MTSYTETKIVLQYGGQTGKFVALDSASGGYPYAVPIEKAHNFGTVDKARAYASQDPPGHFVVCRVTVTYEIEGV